MCACVCVCGDGSGGGAREEQGNYIKRMLAYNRIGLPRIIYIYIYIIYIYMYMYMYIYIYGTWRHTSRTRLALVRGVA